MPVLRATRRVARIISLAALCLTGCSGGGDAGGIANPGGGGSTAARVTSVELSPATVAFEPGATQQLTAIVRDSRGQTVASPNLVWASSSALVAAVSANGLVTAVGNGTAIVTATSPDGPSGVATFVVRTTVASITISPATIDLVVGGPTASLSATVAASDGRPLTNRPLTWSSSSPTVATVSSSGVVTAVGAGTATISATAEGVTGTATARVSVDPCLAVRTLALGDGATGTLASSDCRLTDNTVAQKYQFTLTKTTMVEVVMNSAQLDPYLMLLNAANVVVDEDDDGAGGTSARILRELPAGRYTLFANSTQPLQFGSYDVTVKEAPAACITARTVTLPRAVTATLSAANSCRRNDASYEDRYTLTLTSRTTVSLTMSSDVLNGVLVVLDGTQQIVAQDDDNGDGTNPLIEVTLAPGTYAIQARGYPGETGGYTLDIGTVVDPCAVTRTINIGGLIESALDVTDCPLNDGQGGATFFAQRFRLTLTSTARVQIDALSDAMDTYLILQDAAGSTIATNDDAADSTINAQLTPTLSAGQYIVNVTTYEPRGTGSFALRVSSASTTPVSVSLSSSTVTLQAGLTRQLAATITGSANTAVSWSSSAPAVAAVNSTGLVRALTAGTASITATAVADPSKRATMTVTVPLSTSTTNLDIAALYLVQVTQQRDGRIPLVAEREAVARVFVRGNRTGLSPVAVKLMIYDDLTLVATGNVAVTPTTTIDESCCSADFVIPAQHVKPSLRILAEVDPTNAVTESNERDNQFPLDGSAQEVDVRMVPPLAVQFVPIVQNRNGRRGTPTTDMVKALKAYWPLGTVQVTTRPQPLTIDYVVEGTRSEEWVRLVRDIEIARRAEGFVGYYYGVLTNSSTSGVQGMANGIPSLSAVGIDEQTPLGVAKARLAFVHQMGHAFGLRHAPCGGAVAPDVNFPNADGRTGSWGMNTTVTPAILMPPTKADVMSSCDDPWVGAYQYRKVMDFRDINPSGSALRAGTATPPVSTLLVSGMVTGERAELDVALSVDGPADAPTVDGRFVLEGFDAQRRRVFSHRFSPRAVTDAPMAVESFVVAVALTPAVQQQLERLVVREVAGPRTAATVRPAATLSLHDAVQVVPTLAGGTRLQWSGGSRPVTFVRDRRSRQIVAISRDGALDLPANMALDHVELLVSNGVTSTPYRIDPLTRQLRK